MNTTFPISSEQKLLVFQTFLEGHLLEYVNHLYNNIPITVIFAIPKDERKLNMRTWKTSTHVSSRFFTKEELECSRKDSLSRNLLLRKIVKEVKPTDVLLLTNHDYQPWLPWCVCKNVRYHTFIYYTPVYEWKELNWMRKIKQFYLLLQQRMVPNIVSLYICNDPYASKYLNSIFRTKKFTFFPDPVPFTRTDSTARRINEKCVRFLHMGALSKRKGTLEIVKAIGKIPVEISKKGKWIIAGKVNEQMKVELYDLIERCPNKSSIVFKEGFCSFEEMEQFCKTSDFLLMPYSACSQSSGMFGYSSLFNIPVVATNKGLFKQIIQKYDLGYVLNDCTENELEKFFLDVLSKKIPQKEISSIYANSHTIEDFCNTITNRIKSFI